MKKDIIERLVEVQEKEVKRRIKAVEYVEELTEILAPLFLELVGEEVLTPKNYDYETEAIWIPTWNKEVEKYDYTDTILYFRYGAYDLNEYDREYEGFYVEYHEGIKKGGTDLTEIKGSMFWEQIKVITDWLVNYLPSYIQGKDKSRDKRLEQLEKVLATLSEYKND